MLRVLSIVLLLCLVSSFGSLPLSAGNVWAESESLDTVVLQLKWKHQFQFAGYYAAIEKGFYRDAGLDVVLREASPGQDITDELVSGRADFLVNNPSALLARAEGKPIVALAAIFQHSPLAIFSLKESKIFAPTDMVRRRAMFIPEVESQLVAMFINEGVSLADIKIVPHSWDVRDLVTGKVDAMSAYLTDAPFLLESSGVEYNLLRPITYGIDFYGDVLFTSQAEIDAHPERVKAFREASLTGWAYAMAHPEEIVDLILTKYKSRLSRQALLFEAKQMQSLILPQLVELGHMNPGRWQHIVDVYISLGLLPNDFSLDGFIYDPHPKKDYRQAVAVISALAFCLALALVFVLVLRKMVRLKTEDLNNANRELNTQSSQMSAIINGTTDAIFIKDLDGRYVVINEEVTRVFNRPRQEIIGKDDTHFFPENEAQYLIDSDREIIRNGKVVSKEERVTTVHGERVYLAKKGPVFDKFGQAFGLFGISRDITERKREMEELGRYRDELQTLVEEQTWELQSAHAELLQQERLATLGKLTATVSHELRNPLGTIQSALFSIDESLDDQDVQRATRSMMLAERSIKRCVDIIEELNSYARVKKLDISTTSLDEWVSTIADEFVLPEGINIELDLACGRQVRCDREKLRQVVVNLMNNAVHALQDEHSKGTLLRVSTRLLGDRYEISVHDNGIGMTEDIKENIFEPLFSTKGFGVGLGMVIVKNIVAQHHGEIIVESQPGEGTTVVLRLPIELAA